MSYPIKVHLMGGDKTGWALDQDLATTRQSLESLGGMIQMTSAAGRAQVRAGELIVVPARATITIQAAGPENAAVAEFIPAASEK